MREAVTGKTCTLRARRGAAMIMVICAMALVVALCASLLLGASVVLNAARRSADREQARILALSLSGELEQQIVSFHFFSPAEEAAADGQLWAYLREKMTDGSWPYYNDEERGHTKKYAFRSLSFTDATLDSLAGLKLDGVEFLLYWSSSNDADLDGTPLTVEVTCTWGGEICTVTSEYTLDYEVLTLPDGTTYDRWVWSLNGRK